MMSETLLAMGASLVGFSFFSFFFLAALEKLIYFSSLISALNYLSFLAEDATRDRYGKGGEQGSQPGFSEIRMRSRQPGSMCRAVEGGRSRADGKND